MHSQYAFGVYMGEQRGVWVIGDGVPKSI